MYISSARDLKAFCARSRGASTLAVDTEFIREKTYHPRLCLIQVATPQESAAIDPILIDDLSPLTTLLANPEVTKIFHACDQDLEVIYDALGLAVSPVFDTQVAAAFAGHRYQIGYGALVEDVLGVHLAKAESLSDWSRRPLDKSQLRYAEEDVIYLPGLHDALVEDLGRTGRLSWLAPEMEQVSNPARFIRTPETAYLHLKRSASLTRRQLALARELCAWREMTASKRDIPRKWVCSDELVVEACRRAPTSPRAFRRIRGTERLSDKDVEQMIEAIERGRSLPAQKCPQSMRHERPPAEVEGVVDLMFALLRIISEKSGIAMQLIAGRDELASLALGRKDIPLMRSWRYELAGRKLEELLRGDVGLTVREGRVELL